MAIYFYAVTDPNYEFSNFSPYGIEMDGVWWATVEHWFQAQKFHDSEYQERIRKAHKPKDAINLGRTREVPIRKDWEAVKDDIMLVGVQTKFSTHPKIREKLMDTGDEEIIEISPHDYYWGCGANGSGKNKLGHILVAVREAIRSNIMD